MRIALFITCFNDTLFPESGRAVVRLLERLGHTVAFPQAQTCCGQLHFNTGYRAEAVPLVRRFAEVFEPYDAIVTPSASCAGMIREQHPQLVPGAGEVTSRVYELTELLVDVLGVTDVGAYFPHRVAYHPTCHSLRGLRLGERPLTLLRSVRGLSIVPLAQEDSCCGFGGTFAMKNAETSTAMLADKMRAVLDSGAEVLCAADNSCLLHIGGGLGRLQSGVRTMHLAEILASTEGSTR